MPFNFLELYVCHISQLFILQTRYYIGIVKTVIVVGDCVNIEVGDCLNCHLRLSNLSLGNVNNDQVNIDLGFVKFLECLSCHFSVINLKAERLFSLVYIKRYQRHYTYLSVTGKEL